MKRTSDSAYENKVWSTHRNRKVLYNGEGLSRCVSRCTTLSCCDEGVASLLCSGFFEPRVPCNLIGAHLLGVRKAIEPVRSDPKLFARLMVKQNPKGSSSWLAAIWMGWASKILDSTLGVCRRSVFQWRLGREPYNLSSK
jgi:hypothetical protein